MIRYFIVKHKPTVTVITPTWIIMYCNTYCKISQRGAGQIICNKQLTYNPYHASTPCKCMQCCNQACSLGGGGGGVQKVRTIPHPLIDPKQKFNSLYLQNNGYIILHGGYFCVLYRKPTACTLMRKLNNFM